MTDDPSDPHAAEREAAIARARARLAGRDPDAEPDLSHLGDATTLAALLDRLAPMASAITRAGLVALVGGVPDHDHDHDEGNT